MDLEQSYMGGAGEEETIVKQCKWKEIGPRI